MSKTKLMMALAASLAVTAPPMPDVTVPIEPLAASTTLLDVMLTLARMPPHVAPKRTRSDGAFHTVFGIMTGQLWGVRTRYAGPPAHILVDGVYLPRNQSTIALAEAQARDAEALRVDIEQAVDQSIAEHKEAT